VAATLFAVANEVRSSRAQAHWLASLADSARYDVRSGPSPSIRYPVAGPFDQRLGYTRIPEFVARLGRAGYQVEAQARFSDSLMRLSDLGLFPGYQEKTQAGLLVTDRHDAPLFAARYPEFAYGEFTAVPPVLAESLLYIENRTLLDPRYPTRNPAIDWGRLGKSAMALAGGLLRGDPDIPGGSTLATQIEKYRHSPGGVTAGPLEKLRQMASASLRAYRRGEDTQVTRRQILTDYLNTAPLAAVPGYGEVLGVPSGMKLWYGADFDAYNRLLVADESKLSDEQMQARARAYKQALSLIVAVQRPSFYLIEDRAALTERTHRYLRLLAREGVISARLRDAALAVPLELRDGRRQAYGSLAWDQKASRTVRPRLAASLGLRDLYELDRLDLRVSTTLDAAASRAVERVFEEIGDPVHAKAVGLVQPRLLESGRPQDVIYSFSLYERGPQADLLRVEVDNLEQSLNVNQGIMLDLGSTAKLRTLATYLEVVGQLYDRLAGEPQTQLAHEQVHRDDKLTRWAIDLVRRRPDMTRAEMIEAAMQRRYDASPYERFFTGGGLHRFGNFDSADNRRRLSVAQAFRSSVNLVFVRMMRDVVHYFMFRDPEAAKKILDDVDDPRRDEYLERFAADEGRTYLDRFYRRYRGKSPEDVVAAALDSTRLTPKRLATILRTVEPGATYERFRQELERRLPYWDLDADEREGIFSTYDPTRYSHADLAYLSGLHPLELWMAKRMHDDPRGSYSRLLTDSAEAREQAYRWLFRTRRKDIQDARIRTQLEVDAFGEIHKLWVKHGYPFDSLVPSYGTAIGSSADRPSALAELVGIILNDGVRRPIRQVDRMELAADTPYETSVVPAPVAGKRGMSREVAAALRVAMIDVVENGTGRRASGAVQTADGWSHVIGGKTGTGDNTYKHFDEHGDVISSHVVSRSATFVFFVDDRFYGVLTAFVVGPEAGEYRFTSALATQVFNMIGPSLGGLFQDLDVEPHTLEAAALEDTAGAGS